MEGDRLPGRASVPLNSKGAAEFPGLKRAGGTQVHPRPSFNQAWNNFRTVGVSRVRL